MTITYFKKEPEGIDIISKHYIKYTLNKSFFTSSIILFCISFCTALVHPVF